MGQVFFWQNYIFKNHSLKVEYIWPEILGLNMMTVVLILQLQTVWKDFVFNKIKLIIRVRVLLEAKKRWMWFDCKLGWFGYVRCPYWVDLRKSDLQIDHRQSGCLWHRESTESRLGNRRLRSLTSICPVVTAFDRRHLHLLAHTV